MELKNANQFAEEWFAAWNSHDLDRILAHYHPEVRFTSPFVQRLMGNADGTLAGVDALREYFARALAAYPDLHFPPLAVLPGAGSVVLLYRSVNGLLAAEMMELDAAGRVTRVRAHYAEDAGRIRG